MSRKKLRMLLAESDRGDVLSAANGEEALRLCEDETPAVAILDVIMPKLGG
jgi:DNA-binding NarL/FixJ family response regulator